jgi:hypothetical protein
MLRQLKSHSARIVIGASFFTFGFFVAARALDLTERDIVVGLLAGAIGGITMLVAVIREERSHSHSPLAS